MRGDARDAHSAMATGWDGDAHAEPRPEAIVPHTRDGDAHARWWPGCDGGRGWRPDRDGKAPGWQSIVAGDGDAPGCERLEHDPKAVDRVDKAGSASTALWTAGPQNTKRPPMRQPFHQRLALSFRLAFCLGANAWARPYDAHSRATGVFAAAAGAQCRVSIVDADIVRLIARLDTIRIAVIRPVARRIHAHVA